MPVLYLLFSHKLTKTQEKEAGEELGASDIRYLPDHLQKLWSNVPPNIDDLAEYISPVCNWLRERINTGDYILIQGDYGATFYMVQWAFHHDCISLYAATERKVQTEKSNNGEVEVRRIFEHKGFKKYQQLNLKK